MKSRFICEKIVHNTMRKCDVLWKTCHAKYLFSFSKNDCTLISLQPYHDKPVLMTKRGQVPPSLLENIVADLFLFLSLS